MNVIKILLNLFLSVTVAFSVSLWADDDLTLEQLYFQKMNKLKFDANLTHQQTKSNFLENLGRDCKGFGFKQIDLDPTISPLKVLESYPKEIALKYFKENYKELCFYGFSLGMKYLINEYKDKLDDILNITVMNCFKSPQSSLMCQAVNKEYFYNDVVPLLNKTCSKQSYKSFKKLYCKYKELKKKKCDFYSVKSYRKCPEYQAHLVDIDSLFHLFHTKGCKRFSRKKPRCR